MTVATARDGRAVAMGYRAMAQPEPTRSVHVEFLMSLWTPQSLTPTSLPVKARKMLTILVIAGGGRRRARFAGGRPRRRQQQLHHTTHRFQQSPSAAPTLEAGAIMRIAQKLVVVCALIASVSVAAMSAQSDRLSVRRLGLPECRWIDNLADPGNPRASLLGAGWPWRRHYPERRSRRGRIILSPFGPRTDSPLSAFGAESAAPVAIEGARRGETVFAISPSGPAWNVQSGFENPAGFAWFPAAPEWRSNDAQTSQGASPPLQSAMTRRSHCWAFRATASTPYGL